MALQAGGAWLFGRKVTITAIAPRGPAFPPCVILHGAPANPPSALGYALPSL